MSLSAKRRRDIVLKIRRALLGVGAWRDKALGITAASLWQLRGGWPRAAQTRGGESSWDDTYNAATLSFILRGKLL